MDRFLPTNTFISAIIPPSVLIRPALVLGAILVVLPASTRAQELDLNPRVLYEIRGEEKADTDYNRFRLIGSVGDVNRDGFEDFLVTSHHRPRRGESKKLDYARIHNGLTGVALYDLSYEPEDPNRDSSFGQSTRLGDLDGDAVPDFGVADFTQGTLMIFSGATGTILRSHRGGDVRVVGDLDADRVLDYASNHYDAAGGIAPLTFHGYAEVYSGATGNVILRLDDNGDYARDTVIGVVGDINNDSVPDLALLNSTSHWAIRQGAPPAADVVRIVSGTLRGSLTFDSVPVNQILASYSTKKDEDIQVRLIDLDEDGDLELLGILTLESNRDKGVAVAISTSPGPDGRLQELWRSPPNDTYVNEINFPALIGDVNDDGFSEIVASTRTTTGRVSALYLRSPSDGRVLYYMPPPQDSVPEFTAYSLAVISDLS